MEALTNGVYTLDCMCEYLFAFPFPRRSARVSCATLSKTTHITLAQTRDLNSEAKPSSSSLTNSARWTPRMTTSATSASAILRFALVICTGGSSRRMLRVQWDCGHGPCRCRCSSVPSHRPCQNVATSILIIYLRVALRSPRMWIAAWTAGMKATRNTSISPLHPSSTTPMVNPQH